MERAYEKRKSKQQFKVPDILLKLENKVNEGDYYEAQQMYKTLYFRYVNVQRHDEAINLLTNGACTMLRHQHFNEGTELALLLINLYCEINRKVEPIVIEKIMEIFNLYNGNNSIEALNGKENFMKQAIRWSAQMDPNKVGIPILHDALALSFYEQKDYGKAQRHFLRGTKPHEFARMLVEWSLESYPSERDLIIARSVLLYLCHSNLKDANIIYEDFIQAFPNVPPTPLLNFIRFLLMTLERDAFPLFEFLREKYKPSINRDPTFHGYLDCVAKQFYKVKPAGNFLSDLMGSLFSSSQR